MKGKIMHAKTREAGDAVKEGLDEQASDGAGEIVGHVKAAGTAVWDKVNGAYGAARDKAVRGAKVADKTIRDKPYHAIGVAFGVGLLLGFLLKRSRSSSSSNSE